MTDTASGRDEGGRKGLARRLPIIAIAVVALIGAFTLRDYLSFDTLRDNRMQLLAFRDMNYALTALAYMGIYVAVVAFSLPGALILTLTGGFLFGIFPGVLLVVTSATIGATLIFLAARWGLGDKLAAKMDASEGTVRRIKDGIDANKWEMLFLIRLIPAVPFFVANIVPALVGVGVAPFVVTTFLGIIPGSFVYTSVGAGLGEVFDEGGTPNLGLIFEPQILIPILGLCALAALPIILKAVRGKKGL